MNVPIIEVLMVNDEHRNFLCVGDNLRIRFISNANNILNPLFELSVVVAFVINLSAQYKLGRFTISLRIYVCFRRPPV